MAIAFFRVNERSQNAASKYDYDTRTGRYEGGDLVASGTQNLPSWAQELPRRFWAEADKNEKGNKCRTIIIALPQELNNDELKSLAQEACAQLFRGHATTWAIHRTKGRLSGEDNPHLHVMVCERLIDSSRPDLAPEQYFKKTRTRKDGTLSGGYAKDTHMTKTDRRQWLQETKEAWEAIANRHLQQHADRRGRNLWSDEKEPAAQLHFPRREMEQKKKIKSIHLGPKVIVRMLKGQRTKIGARWIDQKIAPIMTKLATEEKEIISSHTSGPNIWHWMRSWITHPKNKEKRDAMQWRYRFPDASRADKKIMRDSYQLHAEIAAIEIEPIINQLNTLAAWGKNHNIGDGKAHYVGREWPRRFEHLSQILEKRAAEREAARPERERRYQAIREELEAKELEEQLEKERLAAERARREANRKQYEEWRRKKAAEPQQRVNVVHHESRGRGRSR